MAEEASGVLQVEELDRGEYRLRWWIPEDDDYGATVGEGGREPKPKECKDIEWYTAEIVVFRLFKEKPDSDAFGLDNRGFWWSSKSAATKVLQQIKSETKAAKVGVEKKWPDWAVKASAAGWKPPKGWKP